MYLFQSSQTAYGSQLCQAMSSTSTTFSDGRRDLSLKVPFLSQFGPHTPSSNSHPQLLITGGSCHYRALQVAAYNIYQWWQNFTGVACFSQIHQGNTFTCYIFMAVVGFEPIETGTLIQHFRPLGHKQGNYCVCITETSNCNHLWHWVLVLSWMTIWAKIHGQQRWGYSVSGFPVNDWGVMIVEH